MSEVCLLICLERGFCFFVCRWEVYPSLRENKPLPSMRHFYFVITYKSLVRRFVESKSLQHIYIFTVLDIPLNGPSHTLKTNRLTHQE